MAFHLMQTAGVAALNLGSPGITAAFSYNLSFHSSWVFSLIPTPENCLLDKSYLGGSVLCLRADESSLVGSVPADRSSTIAH